MPLSPTVYTSKIWGTYAHLTSSLSASCRASAGPRATTHTRFQREVCKTRRDRGNHRARSPFLRSAAIALHWSDQNAAPTHPHCVCLECCSYRCLVDGPTSRSNAYLTLCKTCLF